MNYIIVLFKNKERKKIIKKFKTFDRAKKFYDHLMEENVVTFNKVIEENVECEYELCLMGLNPLNYDPIFIRDDLGRQIKVDVDDSDYKILYVNKYKIEELVFDVSKNKRITFNDFMSFYIRNNSLKLISKINNKVVVQNDTDVKLFTFKTESESFRFLSILESELIRIGNKTCVIVFDTSKSQKKYLYNVLSDLGLNKKKLYRKYTSFPGKK